MVPPTSPGQPRVAIVVDWLCQFGGAELVIAEIAASFPGADLFGLFDVMAPTERARIAAVTKGTSFLQWVPGIGRRYRATLPLMPLAIRRLDVSGYDIVISSHHAVAKGVIVEDHQLHLCYCHSPLRYAAEQREVYLKDHGISGVSAALARVLLERVRRFDVRSAERVDRFIVNSNNVAGRVERNYGRKSVVVHPPVDSSYFTPEGVREPDLYVTASRHVPYKRIDRIVDAFRSLPDRRLVVLGDGPDNARIRAAAQGAPNITFPGEVPRDSLRTEFRRARAFIFAAEEDFGIVPLEAQACGTPVIALGHGGALETVRGAPGPDRTGLFFDVADGASIRQAVLDFEALAEPPTVAACVSNAERFTPTAFRSALKHEVDDAWASFASNGKAGARR